MSLITPFLPPYSTKVWRAILYCAVGLAILAIALFAASKIRTYITNRSIEKARANVNLALKEVANAQVIVTGDKVAENRAIEDVKVAANAAIEASLATNQAKAEAAQAVADYEAAKKAGVPTGTTEAQLDEKLRALGQ